jgi:hypothetical protein
VGFTHFPAAAARPGTKERNVPVKEFLLYSLIALILNADSSPSRTTPWPFGRDWRPQISASFQPEVARLASEGLQLKESVEASLDGKASHLAAIFQRKTPKSPRESFEFRIFESDGKSSGTIFRRAEFFFTFSSGAMAALNATDINGDGQKEVIVQSSSGGNCWSCNPTEVYRVRNHKAELIAAGPITSIADLDGDGISELLVTDTRWEVYADLSHAASPWATLIYAWKDGTYVNRSHDFTGYYRKEIERLRAALAQARDLITTEESSDDSYIGLVLSIGITCAHMGEMDRGIREIETLLGSDIRSTTQSRRRSAVISDFRSGESHGKLLAIKNGDPLL